MDKPVIQTYDESRRYLRTHLTLGNVAGVAAWIDKFDELEPGLREEFVFAWRVLGIFRGRVSVEPWDKGKKSLGEALGMFPRYYGRRQ